jgi:hypothetical protein
MSTKVMASDPAASADAPSTLLFAVLRHRRRATEQRC